MGLGGITAGGITGGGRGIHALLQKVFPAVGKKSSGRIVEKVLRDADETPESVNRKVAEDPNLTPADVSPEMRKLLNVVTKSSNPARQEVIEQSGVRLSAQKQKVLDKLTRKQAYDAETVIQRYKAKNEIPMSNNYKNAYKSSVNVAEDKNFEKLIQRPSIREALLESMKGYADRTGKIVDGDVYPVEVLDKMSGILGDQAAELRKAGKGTQATSMSSAKNVWDDWLKDNAPESLFTARKLAEKNFQFEDAVRQGQDYLNTPMQKITDTMVKLKDKPEMLKAYRNGAIDAVSKKLARVKEGASLEASFTPAEKKRLKAIMGPRFKGFWDALKVEGKIAKTKRTVEGDPRIEAAPDALGLPVSRIGLLWSTAQGALRGAQSGPARKRREELAYMLTDPSGLKGIPTPDLIKAIGNYRFGAPAAVLPQQGNEPYPAQ